MLDSLIPSLSQIASLKRNIRREDRREEAALSGKTNTTDTACRNKIMKGLVFMLVCFPLNQRYQQQNLKINRSNLKLKVTDSWLTVQEAQLTHRRVGLSLAVLVLSCLIAMYEGTGGSSWMVALRVLSVVKVHHLSLKCCHVLECFFFKNYFSP